MKEPTDDTSIDVYSH